MIVVRQTNESLDNKSKVRKKCVSSELSHYYDTFMIIMDTVTQERTFEAE